MEPEEEPSVAAVREVCEEVRMPSPVIVSLPCLCSAVVCHHSPSKHTHDHRRKAGDSYCVPP